MSRGDEVRWGVAQRFEFIEWRVFWEGRLNRGDLEREFSISTPQASVDLRNYQATVPGNIGYDSSERAYVRTRDFRPAFLNLSGRRYLEQLRGIIEGYVGISDTWFSDLPEAEIIPKLQKVPEDFILQRIVSSVKEKLACSINYLSLTKTSVRQVGPTALLYDGVRWHMRAWCFKNLAYRDFVLGRVLSIGPSEENAKNLPDDVAWDTYVELCIAPHPGLEDHQRIAIERDFMMEHGRKAVILRACLAYYLVRRLNLDLDDLAPERVQLCLENAAEYSLRMRELGLTP
jgi:hypothetical protein